MKLTIKNINPRILLFLGVFPFLIAGIDAISSENMLMIFYSFLLVLANLIVLKFNKSNSKRIIGLILLLNGFLSLLVSFNYYQLAKVALPYTWLVIALLNFLLSIIFLKKYFRGE